MSVNMGFWIILFINTVSVYICIDLVRRRGSSSEHLIIT